VTDRTRWEARYAARAGAPTAEPSRFLIEHRHLLPPGRALDVACGDGRHSLWLARQGFAVDAIDIARAGLSRLAAAARREGLAVSPIQADLEDFPLPASRYTVVVNIRYLQRSLFDALRNAVRPGGVIVFETFLREQARQGHPRNPAFLLEPGELRAQFAEFIPLVDQEGCLETEAGPAFLARLIARRPATSTCD
jgi:2-polyprenyl-3-methyl-5-hydroxy-6-metoxy-1,4-benzoquinol methylase